MIIWEKGKEHRQRFEEIISKADKGARMIIEQTLNFEEPYSKLWLLKQNINKGKMENIRHYIWDIVIGICHRLAGLNNKYYLNNWGKQLAEIEKFTIKPENFKERFEKLVTSNPKEALIIAEGLIDDLQQLYRKWLNGNEEKTVEPLKNIVMGWSSILEASNAIKSSAKKNDLIAAIYATTDFTEIILWTYFSLQNEIWERNSNYPIDEYITKLPEVIRKEVEVLLQSNNMNELVKAAEHIVDDLRQQFISRKVSLPVATTLEKGLKYLKFY